MARQDRGALPTSQTLVVASTRSRTWPTRTPRSRSGTARARKAHSRTMPQHVALVTGAAGGIGAAISRRLARAGELVLVTGRDPARCQKLVDEIRGEQGQAHALVLDVLSPLSVRTALEEASRAGAGA